MKQRALLAAILAAFFLLSSCVSAPPPAPPAPAASDISAPASSADKDRAKALIQGGGDAGSQVPPVGAPVASTAAAPAPAASADVPPPPPGKLTPEEEAYLQNYLARLNYMVYYDEDAGIEKVYAKTAVNQANRYLIEKMGLSVLDFDQVEKNKKDQQAAYQSETGGAIDLIQYLAQKYNADAYVELSFTATPSASGGRFYATAQGSMKIFDTSTGTLLGSVAFQSPQVMNPVSQESAISNALSASVWNAMPKMTEQAKTLIQGSLARGIRYEILVQNTPDSKAMSDFRRALARQVREVEQVSYSAAETKLFIYTFQSRDKVEDAVYAAAERAGMQDLYLVFNRGKAFTFNTGR
jgi:hypothetical protein